MAYISVRVTDTHLEVDMDDEVWKSLPGHEGLYEVSNMGRVRSLRGEGLLMRLVYDSRGYARLNIYKNGVAKRRGVHQLVLEAFVGPRPPGFQACHGDGDAANNRLDNLRWDTQRANMDDRQRHGTHYAKTRTHCKRGHELIASNLTEWGKQRGRRRCEACARAHKWRRSHGGDVDELADAFYSEIAASNRVHEY